MKNWKSVDFEDCPECGSSLEAHTDSTDDDAFYDGDPVRCTSCNYTSVLSVDEGEVWVQ